MIYGQRAKPQAPYHPKRKLKSACGFARLPIYYFCVDPICYNRSVCQGAFRLFISGVLSMEPVIWAALLLLLGLTLVMLEVFVPTGGLLGFLSLTAIVVGIALAFWQGGMGYGFGFLLITAVALPTVLGLAFRWLPRTPIGRRILPALPMSKDVLPDTEERRVLRGLVGKIGTAKSPMLPSGAVVVEGRTIDAVSEGQPIELGQSVRVIEVRGTRVIVRPVEESEETPRSADDPLSRPLDELGIDPFDDPLT